MGIKRKKIIEIKNITKSFGEVLALNNVSFNVYTNDILGIVGNNGAGKTTLLRLLLDLLNPEKGIIFSQEKNVFQSEHWKNYTGAYIDEKFLIDYLTSSEFLYLMGRLRDMPDEEITSSITIFETFMNNEILNNKKYIRNLSSGNKQKVGIVSALLFQPKVVILDEPFNYIDPTSQLILLETLKIYAKKNNAAIVLSSHNLQYISEICNKIILLEKGQIKHDVKNDPNTLLTLKEYFSINQFKIKQ